MIRAILNFTFATALLVSGAAVAADNGVYLGAGVVRSNIEATSSAVANTVNNTRLDDSNNGYKVIVGVRPLDWFAVEANYIDLGKASTTTSSIHAEYGVKGVDAFAVVLLSMPFVDLYAKAGGIHWQADGSITTVSSIPLNKDSGFDPAYGVGAQARLRSLGIRLEYEQFKIKNTDKVSALTLGVTWTFL